MMAKKVKKPIKKTPKPTPQVTCPQGYIYSPSLGKCVLDVGVNP